MANQQYVSAGIIPIDTGGSPTSNNWYISGGLFPDDVAALTPLTASFSDDLNAWADILAVGQIGYLAPTFSDDFNSWADVLDAVRLGLLTSAHTDGLNSWADSVGAEMTIEVVPGGILASGGHGSVGAYVLGCPYAGGM